jgi:DNA-binding response OmpR family regulator
VKKVVVIDNDEGILEMIEETLNHKGNEVKTLTETKNIFVLIKEFDLDLIIGLHLKWYQLWGVLPPN